MEDLLERAIYQARGWLNKLFGWLVPKVRVEWYAGGGWVAMYDSRQNRILINTRFRIGYRRLFLCLVHELAHAVFYARVGHWLTRAEDERFAVCAELLVQRRVYPNARPMKVTGVYAEAHKWFESHSVPVVKQWMTYVLCA